MRNFLCLALLFLLSVPVLAQTADQTVGLFLNTDEAYPGYTLLAPLFGTSTYLIDNNGEKVHEWTHDRRPSGTTYLLETGQLLRGDLTINPALNFGGLGGRLQIVNWDGTQEWEFIFSDSLHALHHDTALLPSGNILVLVWEYHSTEDAIANGRDPAALPDSALWAERIIEVKPTLPVGGEIVWSWSAWDHMVQDFDDSKLNFGVVGDHPERIDINASGVPPDADWIHSNAINYNAELDQIVMSAPDFNELWVIDHGSTTEEAATAAGGRQDKGGDLLYRWGNPQVYDKGSASTLKLHFQHDTQWIPPGLPGAGNFMVFNNGLGRPEGAYSSVLEIPSPADASGAYPLTAEGAFVEPEPLWLYEKPDEFFGAFASGAQRLPNGNTLIDAAHTGRLFEVTTDGQIVWEYVSPVTADGPIARNDSIPVFFVPRGFLSNSVFRAYRYGLEYAAFLGRDLTPMGPIELEATTAVEESDLPASFVLGQNYPNPFNPVTSIPVTLNRAGRVNLQVFDLLGRSVATVADGYFEVGARTFSFDATTLPSGLYVYRLTTADLTTSRAMTLLR